MKILQVITKSSLGGAQSVVINLANALSEMGHEVGVVAGEGDGK
jgi:Mrp family chromosome partitioning ATPase